MRKIFLVILILISVLIGAALTVTAQDSSEPNQLDIARVSDNEFPNLEVLLTLTDAGAIPIIGLGMGDYQASLNGQALPVTNVQNITGDDLPISVVLVIDTSESMQGVPLARTKSAALSFLERLAEGDEVAIIDFDSTVKIAQPFTTDLSAAAAVIEGLSADGRTALYDATFTAAEYAANETHNPRRYVIFLTDGNEYGGLSQNPPQAGITLGDDENVAFYVIGLGFGINADYLQAMAEGTQGEFYQEPTPERLEEIYTYLADFLRGQTVLSLEAELEPDGTTYDLTITAAGASDTVSYTAPDLYPQFSVSGIPEGEISEPITITVAGDAPRGFGSVEANFFDSPSESSQEGDSFSFSYALDPYDYPPGEYELTVTVTDAEGGARSQTLAFSVAPVPALFTVEGIPDEPFITDPALDLSVTVERSQSDASGEALSASALVNGQEVAQADAAPYDLAFDLLPFGSNALQMDVNILEPNGNLTTQSFTVQLDPALFITPTATPTHTPTPTDTPTHTPTATDTPTDTPTHTPTATDTATDTPAPTDTPEPTATATAIPSDTPEPTATATAIPSDTPEPTATDVPTDTPAPTDTPEPTHTAIPDTAEPVAVIIPTDTPEPTATATAIPTDTPAPTDTPTPTDTPEPTATNTPEPTDTPEPTATATDVPTETPEPSITPSQTPSATAEPPREVAVQAEDEGGDLSSILPIAGILLLLLIIIIGYLWNRRRG